MKKILLCGTLFMTIISPHVKAAYSIQHQQLLHEKLWIQKFSDSYDLVMSYLLGRNYLKIDFNNPESYNTISQIMATSVRDNIMPTPPEILTTELEKMTLLLSGLIGQTELASGPELIKKVLTKFFGHRRKKIEIDGTTIHCDDIKNPINMIKRMQENKQMSIKGLILILNTIKNNVPNIHSLSKNLQHFMQLTQKLLKLLSHFNQENIEYPTTYRDSDMPGFQERISQYHARTHKAAIQSKDPKKLDHDEIKRDIAYFEKKLESDYKFNASEFNRLKKHKDRVAESGSATLANSIQSIIEKIKNHVDFSEATTQEELWIQKFSNSYHLFLSYLLGRDYLNIDFNNPETNQIIATSIREYIMPTPPEILTTELEKMTLLLSGLIGQTKLAGAPELIKIEIDGATIHCDDIKNPISMIKKMQENKQINIKGLMLILNTIKNNVPDIHSLSKNLQQFMQLTQKLLALFSRFDQEKWEHLKATIRAHNDPFKIINDHLQGAGDNDFYFLLEQNYQDRDFFEYVINNFLQQVNNSASNPSMHDKLIQIRNLLLKVLMIPLQPQQLKLRTAYLKTILNGMNHHTNDFVVWLGEAFRRAADIENVQPQPTQPQLDKEELRKKMSQSKRRNK